MPTRSLLILIITGIAPATVAAEEAPLPKVAEGWTAKLIAQAPEIAYPTAVVVAPDGTIYLGQDPMDMPGPPTMPIDSIVAIQDGKVSVFADKLWSVMGLEWVDGTLYVVHAPYLSAFRDTNGDGKADARVDLMTGLGPKLTGFNGINDHAPSGIRLGMDGYLYISIGDKGIPEGVAKDGTRIRMFGGGVIRIRPDGSAPEVVSTGERNPLSVALSATDEVFTYGNDDDSKKWPNSLTHHIVGGHYGYPYQFLTHPDRCLPVLGGQIGGSGTQGICYDEDGLPARYRGNLFFTDWGLQTVFRFEIEKAGGTFKLIQREPFVSRGDVPSFRPFSMAIEPGGASFILVDWAFDGWLDDGPKTGRIYRLTYDGSDKPQPAPRSAGNEVPTLLAALDHPARSARLVAQRALARRGGEAVASLIARLKDHEPTTGRLHAIWALDAIGTTEARKAIRDALIDPNAEVRLQAARSAGIRKDEQALSALVGLLRDPDAAVRREAAIALGKLGNRAAGPPLMATLGDADTFAAWSVRHAIRTLGAWDESALVSALLDPKRRDDALKLTDEAWAVPVVRALATALGKTQDATTRARIVANLAGLYRTYPPWSGQWFGTNPLVGQFPTTTQNWDSRGMTRVLDTLALTLNDPDANVRRRTIAGLLAAGPSAAPALRTWLAVETDPANLTDLARGLGRLADRASVPGLSALVMDGQRPVEVRAAALDALASQGGPMALRTRLSLVYDKTAPEELVARALLNLGASKVLPPNDLADFLDQPRPRVRAAALLALAARPPLPAEIRPAIVARLDDPAPEVRKAAIEAVAQLSLRNAIPSLLALAKDEAYRTEVTLALGVLPDPRALPVYLDALNDRDPALRRSAESALLAVRDLVAGPLEERARSGDLAGPAALAVERVLTRFTPIVAWKVIGPFPRTTARVFLGEPSIDFAKPRVGAEGRTIAWSPRRADSANGRVVLDDLKPGTGDRGGFGYDTNGSPDLGAFAYAEIAADRDRSALLLFGSTGPAIVTLNEQVVFNGYPLAGPESFRVRLTKGTNRVLVQVRQGVGVWSFGMQVSDPSASLFATQPGAFGLEALRAFALKHDGDPVRGEALFFDPKGIGCVKCHAAGGRGTANVGPDLTGLALKYDKAEIVRSVLEPSTRLATGYQPLLVALADGKVVTGLLRDETDTYLDLIDADARITRVAKAEIDERQVGDVSLMPTGLVDTLTPAEFADLIAYLRGLKSAPAQAAR